MARTELLEGLSFDDPNVSMMMEVFALGVAQCSYDYEEGHTPFMETRDPRFTGH